MKVTVERLQLQRPTAGCLPWVAGRSVCGTGRLSLRPSVLGVVAFHPVQQFLSGSSEVPLVAGRLSVYLIPPGCEQNVFNEMFPSFPTSVDFYSSFRFTEKLSRKSSESHLLLSRAQPSAGWAPRPLPSTPLGHGGRLATVPRGYRTPPRRPPGGTVPVAPRPRPHLRWSPGILLKEKEGRIEQGGDQAEAPTREAGRVGN